jgi:protein-S-isoprenylcysteine O-methyltransferase Ste14
MLPWSRDTPLGGFGAMGVDVLPEGLTAILLSLPLLGLLLVSVAYWIAYGKGERGDCRNQHIPYDKLFLTLVAIGYFGIWPLWVGGAVLLFLGRYQAVLGFLLFPSPMASFVQVVGLAVLYVGSLFFAWAIRFAGKYLRPSISGTNADHRLIQEGPLGIVRHPYYVSYVLILVGLSLSLATPWSLLLALCVATGMGPTANAEEARLATLFGEEYRQYQRRVGRFFPRLPG